VAEKVILPGISDEAATPTPAPDIIDGRFSFSGATVVDSGEGFYLPFDHHGSPLSPMESGTNVVLPILAQVKGVPNKHHAYFYEAHYKEGTIAERALRYSRLQAVGRRAHKAYHHQYLGTLMPENEAAAAAAVILNSAGYMANMGVHIEEDGISIEEITPPQRVALRKPKVFSIERSITHQAEIGKFLIEYALKQNFDHVKQSHIEEFIELTPKKMAYDHELRARKLRLGMRLTNIAISMAVDPIEAEYRDAYRKRALRKYTPATAWEWAKGLIKDHENDYLETLEDRLISQYGAPA
jgi:hypothetical protein